MIRSIRVRSLVVAVLVAGIWLAARPAAAHPLGNFSISHYSGIRLTADAIQLRYVIDMAEIPTFQEIQDAGIVPEVGHESLAAYRARRAESLRHGLSLEVDGTTARLEARAVEVVFPPGAGGLPTLRLDIVYGAALTAPANEASELRYRDENFADRAGWKEIVAVGDGVELIESSVPARDRSRQLADYPTTLLESPPQDVTARVTFRRIDGLRLAAGSVAAGASRPRPLPETTPPPPVALAARADVAAPLAATPAGDARTAAIAAPASPAVSAATPRTAFTELMTTRTLGLGVVVTALSVATALGALHALEPGHGKTVVAAYLVGSRGTARHALVLGLTVTLAHTAAVYLLGGVTLYASRYIVPERLYPWLGVASGVVIAVLGAVMFLRRYAGAGGAAHRHDGHDHHHGHDHDHGDDHHHYAGGDVSLGQLLALGISGGIVPCPAALVVLLSALALGRVGFGLLLIVAFSVGLAAVLIAIGLLMVYARRLMSRLHGDGPLVTRWLPLTSSAVMMILGLAIAAQALMAAGILVVRL